MNIYIIETFLNKNNDYEPFYVNYCFLKKKKKFYYQLNNNNVNNIIERSIKSILKEKLLKKNVFFIHDLNFNGAILINFLAYSDLKFEVFMRKNQIYKIEIINKKNSIQFKCSFKLLPLSLNQIIQTFNYDPIPPIPFLFINEKTLFYSGDVLSEKFFKTNNEYKLFLEFVFKHSLTNFNLLDYVSKRNEQKIEISIKFLNELNIVINYFKFNINAVYSTPSLALKIFNKIFNKNRVSLRSNFLIQKFIRSSYYGGRCEVYGNPYPKEFIFHFDFAGMYGLCMLSKFAYGKYEFSNQIKNFEKPGFYCIKYTSNMEFPVLPCRHPSKNEVFYANGTNIGTFWFEEIKLFISMGGKIIEIMYGLTFNFYDFLFQDYVNFFFNLRNKNPILKIFSKLMINSLYGRLAMEPDSKYSFFIKKNDFTFYKKYLKIDKHWEIGNLIFLEIFINYNALKLLKLKVSRLKTNLALASSITSKAKIKLYEAQQAVLKNKGRLLYSDTDSIFASYQTNVSDQTHGEIFWDSKKKNTLLKDAIFVNTKTFGLLFNDSSEITKINGSQHNLLSFFELKKKFYENQKLSLNISFIKNNKNFFLKKILINKYFYLDGYNKRIFYNNKKETRPLLLENLT